MTGQGQQQGGRRKWSEHCQSNFQGEKGRDWGGGLAIKELSDSEGRRVKRRETRGVQTNGSQDSMCWGKLGAS